MQSGLLPARHGRGWRAGPSAASSRAPQVRDLVAWQTRAPRSEPELLLLLPQRVQPLPVPRRAPPQGAFSRSYSACSSAMRASVAFELFCLLPCPRPAPLRGLLLLEEAGVRELLLGKEFLPFRRAPARSFFCRTGPSPAPRWLRGTVVTDAWRVWGSSSASAGRPWPRVAVIFWSSPVFSSICSLRIFWLSVFR